MEKKYKKVEAETMQQLDKELNTSVYMNTYESMSGLIYESDDPEDENFYDSEGNVLHFASAELEEIVEAGKEEYCSKQTKKWEFS